MAELPIMPVKTDALFADTTHLSAAEFGGYWLICLAMWRNGAWLKADDNLIRKYSRLDGRSWQRSRETILSFFDVDDDGIMTQKTVAAMYQHAMDRSGKASESAKDRWQRKMRNVEKVSRHSVASMSREQGREHVQKDPKSLENKKPDNANAMLGGCERYANHDPLTKDDDDDPRAGARDHTDDIPFDQVDQDQEFLHQVAQASGVKVEKEADALGVIHGWKMLDLTEKQILSVIKAVMKRKNGGPPKRLAYFTEALQLEADELKRPKLATVNGGKTDDKPKDRRTPRQREADRRLAHDLDVAARLDREG